MAARRRKGRRSRGGGGRRRRTGSKGQGIVSWGTSVIALLLGTSNVIARLKEGWANGSWAPNLAGDFTGLKFNNDWSLPSSGQGVFDYTRLMRGYGPIIGAIAFKKGTSMLLRTARIKSIIPRLSMG